MKLISLALLSMLLMLASCQKNEEPFDAAAQFDADVKAIDDYLALTQKAAMKDNSGVRIEFKTVGTGGLPPKRTHKVKVKFTGKLFQTSEVFEEGTVEGPLNSYIPGWVEAMEILPVGTKATLYIPSGLGYGSQPFGTIPANSVLIYDIELLEVTLGAVEQQQLTSDIAALDAYLSENSIEASNGPFGIRYVITEQGTGATPGWYSKIRVNYNAKLLSTGESFFDGTIEPTTEFDSRVVDFLLGLQVAFQSFPAGTKATIYIPSPLGFGNTTAGDGKIQPNSNLIYELKTFEIVSL